MKNPVTVSSRYKHTPCMDTEEAKTEESIGGESKTLAHAKDAERLPNRWGVKGWWRGRDSDGELVRINDSRGSPGYVFVCLSFPEDAFMVASSSNPFEQLHNLRQQANPRAQMRWTSALCTDQHAAETIVHDLLRAYRCEPLLPWYLLDIDAMMASPPPVPSNEFPAVATRPCLELSDAIARIASAIAHLNVVEGAVAAKLYDIRPRIADYE